MADTPGGELTGSRRETLRLILLLLGWKAAFFLFVLVGVFALPDAFHEERYEASFHYPRGAPPTPLTHLETWDAQHYLYLAQEGYQLRRTSSAFFPLWPWTIRVGAVLTGGHYSLAALLLANALSIVGAVAFRRLAGRVLASKEQADTALLMLLGGSLLLRTRAARDTA